MRREHGWAWARSFSPRHAATLLRHPTPRKLGGRRLGIRARLLQRPQRRCAPVLATDERSGRSVGACRGQRARPSPLLPSYLRSVAVLVTVPDALALFPTEKMPITRPSHAAPPPPAHHLAGKRHQVDFPIRREHAPRSRSAPVVRVVTAATAGMAAKVGRTAVHRGLPVWTASTATAGSILRIVSTGTGGAAIWPAREPAAWADLAVPADLAAPAEPAAAEVTSTPALEHPHDRQAPASSTDRQGTTHDPTRTTRPGSDRCTAGPALVAYPGQSYT
jgi:hypothetical protein